MDLQGLALGGRLGKAIRRGGLCSGLEVVRKQGFFSARIS